MATQYGMPADFQCLMLEGARFGMSIIWSLKSGAYIGNNITEEKCYIVRCHEPFTSYGRTEGTEKRHRWRSELFAINTPFMMDSQAERITREAVLTGSPYEMVETSAQKKRKKKLKAAHPLTRNERKISEMVDRVLPDLTAKARELKLLNDVQTALRLTDNNKAARVAAKTWGCGDMFQVMCEEVDRKERKLAHCQDTIELKDTNTDLTDCSLVGSYVCNSEDHAVIAKIGEHHFLVPGQTSFLTSSFQEFIFGGYAKVKVDNGYDLIVIDPPWLNKSVKRKKSYHMVQEEDLKKLPIKQLAGKRSIVCVWVTNNERLQQFVREELFSSWSVEWIADWIWMKVTQYGEPVYDMNSPHKKPYEKLIIGRLKDGELISFEDRISSRNTYNTSSLPSSVTKVKDVDCVSVEISNNSSGLIRNCEQSETMAEKESIKQDDPGIPQEFVFVSVPSSLHSKKPVLADVLAPYLPSNPQCIELFARNLTPKWISWGNEPLLHQHLDFFESTELEEES